MKHGKGEALHKITTSKIDVNLYLRMKLILILVITSNGIFAQNIGTIQGKIIDNQSGVAIPFATIKLKGKQGLFGVISNVDGDFQIPIKYKEIVDTVFVSCIGYLNKKILIKELNDNQFNIVKLSNAAFQFKEVEVKAKREGRLSAEKIVKTAIESIPYNYPNTKNSYIAYYRDYQREENEYTNLNEAIVEVFDEGFNANDQLTTGIGLYDYKRNEEFTRDSATEIVYDNNAGNKFIPGATLAPLGGNELSILRMHDAIRNNSIFSYSFVNQLNKDFIENHFFKIVETVYLNKIALYHISFESKLTATGFGHFSKGDIYIEKVNHAIHKFEYSTFEKKQSGIKLLYNIQLEYARANALMQLNYISFNNFFKVKNSLDFKTEEIWFDRDNNLFSVSFNHTPEIKSLLDKRNYIFKFDNKKVDIKWIERPRGKDKEVHLHIREKLHLFNAAELSSRIKFEINGVKDNDGKLVNEITYLSVNQFREIFVQESTTHTIPIADSLFLKKDEALSTSAIKKLNAFDITKYWMNTPFKK